MSILDDRAKMMEIDKSNVLGSVEHLPQQIEHAWESCQALPIDPLSELIKDVIIVGMGGSALGGHVIKHTFRDTMTRPIDIINEYHLPASVNSDSLVILSSYSGTTEEVLNAAQDAIDRKAHIAAIAAGGDLINLAKQHKWPYYQIDAVHNPSNQPRMAIGYAVFGQLALLSKLGIITLHHEEVQAVVDMLNRNSSHLSPESKDENQAKLIASEAVDKHLILISAEHLVGGMHVFNNQINENGKHLTTELRIPELNHHSLEALTFPKGSNSNHLFVLAQSDLYDTRNQSRTTFTKEIVEKEGFPSRLIKIKSESKLEQVFELIQIGAYTNLYLAMLHGIDPAPIPNVDHFKELLKG